MHWHVLVSHSLLTEADSCNGSCPLLMLVEAFRFRVSEQSFEFYKHSACGNFAHILKNAKKYGMK